MPEIFFLGVCTWTNLGIVSLFSVLNMLTYLGGYSVGDPPLSIPNREVKPDCADGTAVFVGEQVAADFQEGYSFEYPSFLCLEDLRFS